MSDDIATQMKEAIDRLKSSYTYQPCEFHVVSPREKQLGFGVCGMCGEFIGDWSKLNAND